MVSKKYTKDYRLENTLNRRGKMVTVAVYCGEYYAFAAGEDRLARARVYIVLSTIIYWAAFWLGLAYDTGSMRQIYVSIPYFCGFLPAVYLTSSAYYFVRAVSRPPRKGFTRQRSDQIYTRMAGGSLLTLVPAGLAGAGLIVYFIFEYTAYGGLRDVVTSLAITVMTAAAAVAFLMKKHTKMQPAS